VCWQRSSALCSTLSDALGTTYNGIDDVRRRMEMGRIFSGERGRMELLMCPSVVQELIYKLMGTGANGTVPGIKHKGSSFTEGR
jgi:hypothetical protein